MIVRKFGGRASIVGLVRSPSLIAALALALGCDVDRKPAPTTAEQSSALEGICQPIPFQYIGAEDGCDCPGNGSTTCDPDCTEFGNPGGDWCGCEYCHGPPAGECAPIPPEYLGEEDGCDCPASGSTACDPDCTEFGNPGGEWCGCEYCYGEPGGGGGTSSGGSNGGGSSGSSNGGGSGSSNGGSSNGGSSNGGSSNGGSSNGGGSGGHCAVVPDEYIDADDGCDCPANGDQSCDPDCADGNEGGEPCGCDYCYDVGGPGGGTPSAPPVDPFPPTPDIGVGVDPPFTEVPPDSLLPSQGAGLLPASGGVESGAYTYRIPINVPAGRAGMQPSVGLVYNSRSGDGPAGVGWSIQASSFISRCRTTYASSDGTGSGAERTSEAIQFDESDALCLDGQRLMLVDGEYGFPNSEYRTEVDSFAKVELFDVDLQGNPQTFQVLQKNGLIATYSSRHTDQLRFVLDPDGNPAGPSQSVVMAWPIERLADRSGNYIEYSYSGFDVRGVPLLRRIDYTRCTGAACEYSSPARFIAFQYDERPDTRESYINGVRIDSTERLTSISAHVLDPDAGSVAVENYVLEYVQSAVSGRSLLKSVTLCDQRNTCLPPTEFGWQGEEAEDGQFEVQGLRRLTQNWGGGIGGLAHLDGPVHSFSLVRDLVDAHGRSFLAELENTVAVADVNGDGNDDMLLKHWPGGVDGVISASDAPTDYVLLGDGWGYFQAPRAVNFTGGFPPRPLHAPDDPACLYDGPVDYSLAQAVDMDMDGRQEVVVMINDGCPFRLAFCNHQNGTFSDCDFRVTAVFNQHINYDVSFTSYQRYYDVLGWDAGQDTVGLRSHPQIPHNAAIGGELNWPSDRLQFLDLTGDGLPDMMQGKTEAGEEWKYMIAAEGPLGFDDFALSYAPNPAFEPNPATLLRVLNGNPWMPFGYSVVDEDGDGRDELLQRDAAVYKSFTLDRHLHAERRLLPNSPIDPYYHPLSFAASPPDVDALGAWRFADINGDGLKDAVYLFHPEDELFQIYIRINTGAGYLPLEQYYTVALDEYFEELGAGRVRFQQNTDTGLRLADMNGDGRDDLVILGPEGPRPGRHGPYIQVSNRIRVIPSDGSEFPEIRMYELPNHGLTRLYGPERGWSLTQIAELDGNGLPEIVDLAVDQDDSGKRQLITMSRPNLPGGTDLITEVHDAYGLAEEITYGSLSWQAKRNGIRRAVHLPDTVEYDESPPASFLDRPEHFAADAEPCVYPARCVARGAAVKRYQNYRGSREIETAFRYAGARADVTGRGFLGFRAISERDEVTGHLRHFTYDQSHTGSTHRNGDGHAYLKLGAPTEELVMTHGQLLGSNADLAPPEGQGVYSVVRRLWTFTDEAPYRLDYQRTTRELRISHNFPTWRNTLEGWFDDYGNVTDRSDLLETYAQALEGGFAEYLTVLDAEFDIREDAWIVSAPRSTTVTVSTNTNPYEQGDACIYNHDCDRKVRKTSYTHDSIGRLESTTVEPNNAALRLVRTLKRDGAGLVRVDTATAADGTRRISKIDYDEYGLHPQVTQNAAGHVAFSLNHPSIDQPLVVTDANGATAYSKYDYFGRLREQIGDDGSASFVSYAIDHVRTEEPGGPRSVVFFDERGRRVVSAWSTFEGGAGISESRYDSLGNTIQERYASTSDSYATATATRNSLNGYLEAATQTMSAQYDVLGRPVSTTNGVDETTDIYHENLYRTVVTDPEDFVRVLENDGRGNVVTSIQYVQRGNSVPDTVWNTFRYEAQGKLALVELTGDTKYRASFNYDQFARVKSQTSTFGNGNKSYVHSAFGEVEEVIDRGMEIELDHDALGRITRREHMINGGDRSTFVWDEGEGGVGRLSSAVSNEHRTEYRYDPLGRQREVREFFANGEELSVGWDYHADGRLRSVRYPEYPGSGDVVNHPSTAGLRVRYEYENGEIERISDFDSGQALWLVEERHPFGMITGATDRAGLASSWQYYDDTLRLLRHDVGGVSGGPLSQQFIYWATGQLLVSVTGGGYTESFTYDGARRLTRYDRQNGFESFGSIGYTYHDNGNIQTVSNSSQNQPDLPRSVETYQYDPVNSHLLRRIVVDPEQGANVVYDFDYDAAGRQTERVTEDEYGPFFDYNSFDLPNSIYTGSRYNDYDYDAFGKRVTKLGSAATVERVAYVGGYYEARDFLPPGAPPGGPHMRQSVYRIMGDGGPVAEVVQDWGSDDESVSYLHTDQHGSITSRTTDTTVERSGFFPFGRRTGSYPNPPEVFASTGYTGHEHDDELGLINMQGRMYDPRSRRFLTPDPVVGAPLEAGGINPYSYVLNDPMNLTDPSGFQAADPNNPYPEVPFPPQVLDDVVIVGQAPPGHDDGVLSLGDDGPGGGIICILLEDRGGADSLLTAPPGDDPFGLFQSSGGDFAMPSAPVPMGPAVFMYAKPGVSISCSGPGVCNGPIGDTFLATPYTVDRLTPAMGAVAYDMTIGPFVTLADSNAAVEQRIMAGASIILMIFPPARIAAALRGAKGVATIDTSLVRFSQDSVGATFRNGTNLNDAIGALRAGGAQAGAKYPPIRLFERNGALYSLDNRRLLVFSQAGQEVPFRMATQAELAKEFAGKFTTTAAQGWGQYVWVRP